MTEPYPFHEWQATMPYSPDLSQRMRAFLDCRRAGRNFAIGLCLRRGGSETLIQYKLDEIARLLNELDAVGGQEWAGRDILNFPGADIP